MIDPFNGPKLVLNEGAKKHIDEFNTSEAEFFNAKPYTSVAEIDGKTGDLVHKVKLTTMPSDRLRYITYSAFNDLKNALDQAVCAACLVLDGPKVIKNAYFPFAENPNDLAGMLKSDRYSDIPASLHPFLNGLEPYPTSDSYGGGDDILRSFGKVANPNKHQIPLSIGIQQLSGAYSVKSLQLTHVTHFQDPFWDSAKNEIVIARTKPTGTCQYDLAMPFYISLAEAGPLTSQPVSGVLGQMASKVDRIIGGFEAETTRILRERGAS
ncbi:hypothetical protein V1282_005566 [Nitrobacteraceae bacterium AZCC 2146]